MESCPDCTEVKQLYKDNPEYELIDIGVYARSLKEFLVLRDNHPAFEKVRERGNIGIPCFVKENGDVFISLKNYDAATGAKMDGNNAGEIGANSPAPYETGAACNLDGTGC